MTSRNFFIQSMTHLEPMMNSDFSLAFSELIDSTENLPAEAIEKFSQLITGKLRSGWNNKMIEIHVIANIADRIKTFYPKLSKHQRLIIADEMMATMLQNVIKSKK